MILHFARTLHSYKACAVARHTGLAISYAEVDLLAGAHRTPAFLAMNPCGRTPVLDTGEIHLWESNAIMCRLAIEAGSTLWPEGAAQAEVLRWLSWDAEHFKPHAGAFYFEHIIRPAIGLGDPDPRALEAAAPPFHASAAILDRHLARRDFLVGDAPTIADFAVAVTLPFAAPSHMPIDGYTAIRRWHDRLMELPAWREPFAAGKTQTR